ncbi:hypothetical protein GCM10007860_21240 [Chitiniphilus shinanonensis]|uniref:Uncharacterized protein n=1 Tax=Chitiniphilus shinanonensis TaxID=553088 RepID=A0ABQ6BSJ9_9NEIS|nr:hypothetical protein [Chitiniphilus shinanonensis]GLS04975.1 hypothetical protein GCM10007860_21240 [Chitiniphilus shinanonensis]
MVVQARPVAKGIKQPAPQALGFSGVAVEVAVDAAGHTAAPATQNRPTWLHTLTSTLLTASLLTGCGTVATVKKWVYGDPPRTDLRGMRVLVDTDANGNTATAMDVVLVYSANGIAMLPKTGPDWFSQKTALLATLGPTVDVVPLQLPPAAVVDPVPLPKRYRDAVGIYAFPNYIDAKGQPVLDLTRYRKPTLRLRSGDIQVGEAAP